MKNLVWLLFLPGFLCHQNPLKITPDYLVTVEGSNVVIPCQINRYGGALLRDISLHWYFQPVFDPYRSEYSGVLLFNSSATSSDNGNRLPPAFAGRLEFLGNVQNNVEKKSCSLKIFRFRTEDSGVYGARLFASYNWPAKQNKWFHRATVNVAGHWHDESASTASGPEPTTESEGPQSSPALPSAPEGVSSPLPSASSPPSLSELPPSGVPPLPSSQAPHDGRTLREEFSFLSESQNQAVKAHTQFIHSCPELRSAVVHLTEQFRKALLQIRQRTCAVPREIKKP